MNVLTHIILAGLIGSFAAAPCFAQSAQQAGPAAKAASAADMTEGEIKKIDKDAKKLTIKHGEIKNLDMPGMTMVFKVKDPAMIDSVKVGDKVRFVVENSAAGFVVTEMVPAREPSQR